MKNQYVNIRMTSEMKDALSELAKDESRSLSGQITYMLQQAIKKPVNKPVKRSIPKPNDVSEQTWDDWLKLRAAKKAPVTERALDGIYTECLKAGITLESALRECCSRGWTGFKAEWMMGKKDQLAALLSPSHLPAADGLIELEVRDATDRMGR